MENEPRPGSQADQTSEGISLDWDRHNELMQTFNPAWETLTGDEKKAMTYIELTWSGEESHKIPGQDALKASAIEKLTRAGFDVSNLHDCLEVPKKKAE